MRRVLFTCLLLITSYAVAIAQDSYCLREQKGYSASVGIINAAGITKNTPESSPTYDFYSGIETIHGYSFGDGFIIGGGLSVGTEYYKQYTPVFGCFVNAQYAFLDGPFTPFVGIRSGVSYRSFKEDNTGYASSPELSFTPIVKISPCIGIAFHRYSVALAYELSLCRYVETTYVSYVPSYVYLDCASHFISLNFAFHF